jgi:methylmalonyl-CoA mutase C-terminal domain/subunit
VVRTAIDEDVDVVGVSILSGAHEALLPRVRALLDDAGANDVLLVAGGVIPQEDIPALEAQGVAHVFLSGTSIPEIVEYMREATAVRAKTP